MIEKASSMFKNICSENVYAIAPKLYMKAEKARSDGDEVLLSYLFYLRYLGVQMQVLKCVDFERNKGYYELPIDGEEMKVALYKLKRLNQSLADRYKFLQEQQQQEMERLEQERKKAEEERQKRKIVNELKEKDDWRKRKGRL